MPDQDGHRPARQAAHAVAAKLKQHGLTAPGGVENLQKIVAGKQLWNYDNLEPHEKKLVL